MYHTVTRLFCTSLYVLVCLDIEISDIHVRLLNVYSPNISVERKQFFTSLDKFLCHPNIILGGDFNCVYDTSIDKVGGNPLHGTAGSHELRSLCKDFDLCDAYRFLHPRRLMTTWHGRGEIYLLD